MSLINITPVMTSNTTPSPYVVNSSTVYGSFYAWKAFNNINTVENDAWVSTTSTGWISLYFGTIVTIKAFSISASVLTGTYNTTSPKNFTLQGSNDGINYKDLKSFSNEVNWTHGETRIFVLDNEYSYPYFRLNITANNGYGVVEIGELKFLRDYHTEYINSTKASLLYCLPKNTTNAMISRLNDFREGLLGFANDGDNYGTLWMINNLGKSMMPMAATKQEQIFSGNASVTGTYSVSEVFNTYNFINITANIVSSSVTSLTTITIPVDDFLLSTSSSSYRISIPSNATNIGYIDIYYVSENTFNITVTLGDFTSIAITKIYGIY